MNLIHLKYAVEIERFSSISKAAENLYVSQSFLSKSIKELEQDLGIEIFRRTPRGVVPTEKGELFLAQAKEILAHVEAVESQYKTKPDEEFRFAVTVPIACYIAHAFTEFMRELAGKDRMQVDYLEANSMTAIDRVAAHESSLGIIRYRNAYEDYFLHYLDSRELSSRPIWSFHYRLVMAKDNPLMRKDTVLPEDLADLIEISHGDPTVPTLPASAMLELRRKEKGSKEITVYERQSQFGLLRDVAGTYMWASPTPKSVLDDHGMEERECSLPDNECTDVLIYRKGYRFTAEDRLFLQKISEEVASLQKS